MKQKKTIQLCVLAAVLAGCGTASVEKDYTQYVNPFIGTGGHGHTYPGAVLPNGMIHPSPDTRIYEWDACSGYYYADSTINERLKIRTRTVCPSPPPSRTRKRLLRPAIIPSSWIVTA